MSAFGVDNSQCGGGGAIDFRGVAQLLQTARPVFLVDFGRTNRLFLFPATISTPPGVSDDVPVRADQLRQGGFAEVPVGR